MPRLAVFDVDHTITRASTGRRLIQAGRKAGIFSLGNILSLPYHYVRYRSGKLNVDRALTALARIQGQHREALEGIARRCFDERIVNDIMPQARECIEAHIRAGDVVALATSSLRLIVKPLADHFGIGYVLATELEYEEGVATGRLATEPCLAEEKRDRVEALASALRVSLSNTSFYSDSHMDLPLLRIVGEPVAVNPDARLRKEASSRGWEIVKFS
ncbi:MAG: HAD family hydrolase [Spirochaetota bacterium]